MTTSLTIPSAYLLDIDRMQGKNTEVYDWHKFGISSERDMVASPSPAEGTHTHKPQDPIKT